MHQYVKFILSLVVTIAPIPWFILMYNALCYIVGDDPFLTFERGLLSFVLGAILIFFADGSLAALEELEN